MSRTPLIRALVIGCLATVSLGCGAAEKLPGGKLTAAELGALLEHRHAGAGPYSCKPSNSGWDYVCSYASDRGEVVKVGVEVSAREPNRESAPVPVTSELPAAPGTRQTRRERAAFVRRLEATCARRASDLRRLKSPRTRREYLSSFAARRLAEAAFGNSVARIVPPTDGMEPFRRLKTAAQTRVDAVDRFHDAVLARKLPEGRAAFAESRSASLVVAREAQALGATCAA